MYIKEVQNFMLCAGFQYLAVSIVQLYYPFLRSRLQQNALEGAYYEIWEKEDHSRRNQ